MCHWTCSYNYNSIDFGSLLSLYWRGKVVEFTQWAIKTCYSNDDLKIHLKYIPEFKLWEVSFCLTKDQNHGLIIQGKDPQKTLESMQNSLDKIKANFP